VESKADRPAIFRQDSRLHLALAALSGNRHLEEALHRLDVKVMLCRLNLCVEHSKIAHDVRFHRRIIEALKAGDAEAAVELMRRHLQSSSPPEEALV
jgi:GntR family transcriptional repressor for pyruvate dehydrogenase complex